MGLGMFLRNQVHYDSCCVRRPLDVADGTTDDTNADSASATTVFAASGLRHPILHNSLGSRQRATICQWMTIEPRNNVVSPLMHGATLVLPYITTVNTTDTCSAIVWRIHRIGISGSGARSKVHTGEDADLSDSTGMLDQQSAI